MQSYIMSNVLKPSRIFLPQIIALDLIKDKIDIILEIFFDDRPEIISRKLSVSIIVEDNNFLEYINDDHSVSYLYKKSGSYKEIQQFYDDIRSGKFADFDLSSCKIDLI